MWTRVNNINRMFDAREFFRSQMNRLFTDFDRSYSEEYGWIPANGTPRTNLYDNGDYLEIKTEVPGVTKEDLNIRMQGNYLEISGTRKSDAPENYKANRVERGTTSFTRSFTVPEDIDAEKVKASLQDGILSVL